MFCSISDVVELSDRDDLFQIVDNEQVTRFSQSLGKPGFGSAVSVLKSTGVEERRICRPGVFAIDLALSIAERLQDEHNFAWDDCAAIALSHSHADRAAAEELRREFAAELGIDPRRIYAINFGCVGYLELLRYGAAVLAQDGGLVPVFTVETPHEWHDASDRMFCGIVSAGATGTLLHRGRGHRLQTVAVREVAVESTVEHPDEPLFWLEAGEVLDFFGQPVSRQVMRMNGESVFRAGLEVMIDAFRRGYAEVSGRERRVVVASHQPSGKMLRAMIAVLRNEFPQVEFLNNLAHYANSISSTVPTVLACMDEILEREGSPPIAAGDMVLLPAAGICMAHKESHLAEGWAVIEW